MALLAKPQAVLLFPLAVGLSLRDPRRPGALLALACFAVPPAIWLAYSGRPGLGAIFDPFYLAISGTMHPNDRGAGGVVGSLLRLGMFGPALPLLLPVPFAVRHARGDERVVVLALIAVGASGLFAFPFLWQTRHLLVYVAALALAGTSAVPTLAVHRPRAAMAVAALYVVALPYSVVAVWRTWNVDGSYARCDETTEVAGAWLRAHARGLDRGEVLATDNAALQAEAGFVVADPALADLFGAVPHSAANPGQFWLVTGPGLPLRPTTGRSVRERGLRPDAVLAATLPLSTAIGEVRVYGWPAR